MKRKDGPVEEPLSWTEVERVINEAMNNKVADKKMTFPTY